MPGEAEPGGHEVLPPPVQGLVVLALVHQVVLHNTLPTCTNNIGGVIIRYLKFRFYVSQGNIYDHTSPRNDTLKEDPFMQNYHEVSFIF